MLFSCRKPEDDFGLAIQPSGDQLLLDYVDTTTIVAYSYREDSLKTSNLTSSILGSYVDPDFGAVKASIYTQVILPSNGVEFGNPDSIEIDSLVLSFDYLDPTPHYGSLDPQNIHVYELMEDLYLDSTYQYFDSLTYYTNDLIQNSTIVPRPFEAFVSLTGDTLDPQLRLQLDTAIARKIIDEANAVGGFDKDAFLEFFKGFYITTNTVQTAGQGAILSLNTPNSNSKLTMYYRDVTDFSDPDTLSFDFFMDNSAAKFGRFEHDYNRAINRGLVDQLADSSVFSEFLYLQAAAGINIAVDFPYLQSLRDSGDLVVNHAMLVVPIKTPEFSGIGPLAFQDYRVFESIYPVQTDSLGINTILPDQLEGNAFLDGFLDITNAEYRINITRYLQSVISDGNTNQLSIIPTLAGVSATRTILNSPDHPDRPMKLLLTYTVIKTE